MRENKYIELKEKMTDTFLKTVSAYANYGTGIIIFGVRDDGKEIGVEDPKNFCAAIENKINDTIVPIPDYSLEVDDKNKIVTLKVYKGMKQPYFYKSKAYKRNDASTREIDNIELKRLILEGENITYDRIITKNQDLQFEVLSKKIIKELGIEKFSNDTLISLGLYNKNEGYNIAAECLADKNNLPGIDLVRFGEDINTILDRKTSENISILKQYDDAIEKYKIYYQYEEIKEGKRTFKEKIPYNAYREALANALVHRTWDVNNNIKISMYDKYIEIISPGGLPSNISKEEYLYSDISELRNPIIANIFFRLHMIEKLGTGIGRINKEYENSFNKPKYEIFENSIKTILPIKSSIKITNDDEKKVYETLNKVNLMSATELSLELGMGKTKTTKLLNSLIQQGFVKSHGVGRSTKYCRVE